MLIEQFILHDPLRVKIAQPAEIITVNADHRISVLVSKFFVRLSKQNYPESRRRVFINAPFVHLVVNY